MISANGSVNASCYAAFSCGVYPDMSVGPFEPNPARITDPTELALFETGSPVPLTAEISILSFNSSAFEWSYDTYFAGDLTVNYLTSAPTPERSTLALLGVGVIGMGFKAARRRRSIAAAAA